MALAKRLECHDSDLPDAKALGRTDFHLIQSMKRAIRTKARKYGAQRSYQVATRRAVSLRPKERASELSFASLKAYRDLLRRRIAALNVAAAWRWKYESSVNLVRSL